MIDKNTTVHVLRCRTCGHIDNRAIADIIDRATIDMRGHDTLGFVDVVETVPHQTRTYRLAPEPDLCCLKCGSSPLDLIPMRIADCPHVYDGWLDTNRGYVGGYAKAGAKGFEVNRHCRICGKWERGLVSIESIKEMN